MKYPRGSEWRKWDLHIHSPLSILSNKYPKLANGDPDWEKYLKRLEGLDISALGVTDYFSIEGYKKILEFKQAGRLSNISLILPNIEFRLDSVLSSRKDGKEPRRLNYHVIFSDEITPKDIEEHFLNDLSFYYEGNPQEPDESRKLKLSNLTELGKKLISQHANFTGRDPLELGASCAVVRHQDITDILTKDSRFRGKYLLVLPEELSNLIEWDGQDHLIRKGLLQKSDMVFSSNPKTAQWCLGKDPYMEGENKFKEEFKTLKPCIHGSDSHDIEEIGVPCAKRGDSTHKCSSGSKDCELRYCWIKSDPTFEGLKQLLYEPEDRVVIQPESPIPPRSNLTIDKITIGKSEISDELSIAGTDIELNQGLVAVAGGKGAGKTAFVDLIANCYVDRVNSSDANSFVKRIADQDPDIDIKLGFRDKSVFSKKVLDQTYYDAGQVVYIAQGELERYIGDRSDLDQYVNNLIFQSPKIQNSVEKYEFSKSQTVISDLEQQIQTKSNLIESMEQTTRNEIVEKASIREKQLETELKDIIQRIVELEKSLSGEKVKIAKEKQEAVSELKNRRDLLIRLKEQLRQASAFIDQEFPRFNSYVATINSLLKQLKIPELLSDLSYSDCSKIQERLVYIEQEINKAITSIGKAQKEIDQFETGIKTHAAFLDKKREIELALAKAKEESKQLGEKKKNLTKELAVRKELYTKLVMAVLELKKKYDSIIALFSTDKARVLSDLDFVAEIDFDSNKLLGNAEDVVDNRRVFVKSENDNKGVFDSLIKLYQEVSLGDETKVAPLIDEIERLSTDLKGKIKASSAIGIGDFYRFLYGNYLSVIPVVKYKNTSVNKLSLGQKATVLIKIYLAEGDKPIIIDSHDDHLDNEFIMDELICSIREAKKYRQVILVSNNGNVVINSDSEQVILADRDGGGKISYISGSIEAPEIRDRAVKVLEGGSGAFKKRQQKYRI
ncbi:MAG: hypothetical protein WC826_05135 [Microgenomates group bacterium]|jgi:hypothetical protein